MANAAPSQRAGPWDDSVRSPDDDGEYFARVMLASKGFEPQSRADIIIGNFVRAGAIVLPTAKYFFEGGFIP